MDHATDVISSKLANASISPARLRQKQSAYDYVTRISYFNYMTQPVPAGSSNSDPVEVPFVQLIGEIFNIPPKKVRIDVLSLSGSLTIMDYVDDLKQILTSLGPTNSSLVKEFASEEEYRTWKGFEISEINQLILGLVDNTLPERPQSAFGISHHLAYIPPDPPAYYYSLLKICMARDIPLLQAKFAKNPELEDPLCRRSVPVLAKDTQDLFNSLYVSWRISRSTREVLLMKSATDLFVNGQMTFGMLCNVVRLINFQPRTSFVTAEEPWKLKDKRLYINCLKTIHSHLMRSISRQLVTLWDQKKVDLGHVTATMEFYLYQDLLFAESGTSFETTVHWFRDSLKKVIRDGFSDEIKKISRHLSWPDMFLSISVLSKALMQLRDISQLCDIPKQFAEIDIVHWKAALQIDKIVAEGLVEAASAGAWDVHDIVGSPGTRQPPLPTDDVTMLKEMLNGLIELKISTNAHLNIFEQKLCSYAGKYFDAPDITWIDGIIKKDKFSWSEQQHHSSSAVRVAGLFSQCQKLITSLHLPSRACRDNLVQSALKNTAVTIQAYVMRLRARFCNDLDYSADKSNIVAVVRVDENEWLPLYKVSEKTCVEMNYVSFLKEKLLRLHGMIDNSAGMVDMTRLSQRNTRSAVTIIEARDLQFLVTDSSAAHVHVEINDQESRTAITRTRSVLLTSKPRWTEDFGFATQTDTKLEILIRQQDYDGTVSVLGRCTVDLNVDEERISPFVLPMSPTGYLQIAIKRTQTTDSVISCYENALSDIETQDTFMAMAIAEKFHSIIDFVFSNANLQTIEEERQESLDPTSFLLDYFEDNFEIMQRYLNPRMRTIIMTKVWEACVKRLLYLLSEDTCRREVDVINQWLQILRRFFHGDGRCLSIGVLESVDGFRELLRRVY
ncbi:hypothetical protein V1517DRAFT_317114 [Lipomyces orientalis]|uniref:Uncharacterized protein n=1 Tax=Lipomyces orientalis TaxID=1233043 RepID=A0ACC3TUQ3_9ASCO